jgi:hypothetical protein
MRHRSFTTLPFLVAFLIGLLPMGLSVYDVHARQLGTLDVGHTSTATADMAQPERAAATTLLARLRAWSSTVTDDERGAIAAELLAPVSGIKALKQRAADLVQAMKVVQTKLGDAGLAKEAREEARADLSQLVSLADANTADLEQAERIATFERSIQPVADPDAAATSRAAAGANVQLGKDRAEDDPKRGFKDHRDFLKRRHGRRPRPRRSAAAAAARDAGLRRAGRIQRPGRRLPRAARRRAGHPLDRAGRRRDRAAPDAGADDSADGVVQRARRQEPRVQRQRRLPGHASPGNGRRHREPRAFEQVTLTANEEFGLAFASERIINDSPTSFVAIIQAGMSTEYVANAMNERINGTGAGERQGALNAGCKIAVAKETGQAAATIVKENIDKMAARCWRYGQAVWLANQNTRPQLKSLVQVVGVGGNAVPYFVTDGAPAGFDGMLDGRPLVFTEFAKTLGTEGDLILIVPSQYLEGTYQSEQYAESIHVRFAAAERGFRFYRRNDGQWWWRSALTPKNGSTLSPVVTLATRS